MRKTVNIEAIDQCAKCGRETEVKGDNFGWPIYGHKGEHGKPEHYVSRATRCGECKGPIAFRQDAYADYWECESCETQERRSIGD